MQEGATATVAAETSACARRLKVAVHDARELTVRAEGARATSIVEVKLLTTRGARGARAEIQQGAARTGAPAWRGEGEEFGRTRRSATVRSSVTSSRSNARPPSPSSRPRRRGATRKGKKFGRDCGRSS